MTPTPFIAASILITISVTYVSSSAIKIKLVNGQGNIRTAPDTGKDADRRDATLASGQQRSAKMKMGTARRSKSGRMGMAMAGGSTHVMTTGVRMSGGSGGHSNNQGINLNPQDLVLGAKGLALTGVLIGQFIEQNGGIGNIFGGGFGGRGFGFGGGGFNGGIPREGIIPNRFNPERRNPDRYYPENRNPDRYFPENRNPERFNPNRNERFYPNERFNPNDRFNSDNDRFKKDNDRFHSDKHDERNHGDDETDANADANNDNYEKVKITESNDTCLLDSCN